MLARIARDYLAFQGYSVPSEHAFSSGGLTGTRLHGRLAPRTFEALHILKSGYWNGHIGAAEQAKAHYNAIMEVINIVDDDENEGQGVAFSSSILCQFL